MMFEIRDYQNTDLDDCALCLFEGFFDGNAIEQPSVRKLFLEYANALAAMSNFMLVAVYENKVVGFLCGSYKKKFNKHLAKAYLNKHYSWLQWKFLFKYLFNSFGLDKEFKQRYNSFMTKARMRDNAVEQCDCELLALASRKDYRKGLGTALVNGMMNRCESDKCRCIRVFTGDHASYRFYEKYGFTLVSKKTINKGDQSWINLVYEYSFDKIHKS